MSSITRSGIAEECQLAALLKVYCAQVDASEV